MGNVGENEAKCKKEGWKLEKIGEKLKMLEENDKNFFGVFQNGNFHREKAKNHVGKKSGKVTSRREKNREKLLEKFPCYAPDDAPKF